MRNVLLIMSVFLSLTVMSQTIPVNIGSATCDVSPVSEYKLVGEDDWTYTTQVIYRNIGFLDDKTITTIRYKVVSYSNNTFPIVRICMKDTGKKKLKKLEVVDTEVFVGQTEIKNGYMNIQLQKPYNHRSGKNLIVQVETYRSGYIVFNGTSSLNSMIFDGRTVKEIQFAPLTEFLY